MPGIKYRDKFGFDFANGLTIEQWQYLSRIFRKRHLLAHKMGVIDDEYIQQAYDPDAVAGRNVHVTPDEVCSSVEIIEMLGRKLFRGILPTSNQAGS